MISLGKRQYGRLSRGGILLTTLVLFLLFIVMMVAAIDYINQQYKAATDQEETQKAFRVAEAGVDYTMFLLAQNVTTMAALKTQQTSIAQSVTDPGTTTAAGSFINTYTQPTAGTATEGLQVSSKGTTAGSNRCETVVATIEHRGDQYSLIAWDHKLGCQ